MEDELGTVYSLRDLMRQEELMSLNDKIFTTECSDLKHCIVKMNRLRNQKLLVQVVDMSDKILYTEVKAEQSFLTLINATVSHELRNPLSSLIG